MINHELRGWIGEYGLLLLLLLAAAAFRFHDLAGVPPGLTHDEADHGLTAWQIASEGLREIYFTVGYGREPLYDYLTALLMAFMGPSSSAGRLVSAFASLIMIAAMIAWLSRSYGRGTALMTGAGLAVGFWPVVSGRQALRSILLPALFALAVLIFWLAVQRVLTAENKRTIGDTTFDHRAHPAWLFIAAGIILGLSFYTYIPARAMWLVFPMLLGYWLLRRRDFFHRFWRPTSAMLMVMFATAAPLFVYLWTNPGAETRITQLAQPVIAAQQGNFGPLAQHASSSLRLFFLEGDPTWRYNIAGKPLLGPLFGSLFLLGLVLLLWQVVRGDAQDHKLPGSAAFLSLSWLALGFLPVLITGPALSMTQAIGMQPMLYLLPAVALSGAGSLVGREDNQYLQRLFLAIVVALYAALAVGTYRDYFRTWANSPEVRVQYEATTVAAIEYLNSFGRGEAAVSTITPGQYHSPALAQLLLRNRDVALRWYDGRGSLPMPRAESAALVVPGFTPIPAALLPYLDSADLVETLPLRDTDLDRPLRFYKVDRSALEKAWGERLMPIEAQFGEIVDLTGYDLQTARANPGDQVSLVTQWQARQPVEGLVLFTHIVGPDSIPVAQADRLDVPSYGWQTGDRFLQLHQISLPPDLAPGAYQVVVGAYRLADGRRLLPTGSDAPSGLLPVATLTVVP